MSPNAPDEKQLLEQSAQVTQALLATLSEFPTVVVINSCASILMTTLVHLLDAMKANGDEASLASIRANVWRLTEGMNHVVNADDHNLMARSVCIGSIKPGGKLRYNKQ